MSLKKETRFSANQGRGNGSTMVIDIPKDEEEAIWQLRKNKRRARREKAALKAANRPKPSMPKFNLPPYEEEEP